MSFRNRHSFRTAHSMSGLGNIIEDISGWAGDAKGNAKQWLDENIGKGTGNIAESLGNEAVDYGKGYATEKANEQISKWVNPNQNQSSNTPPITNTNTNPPISNSNANPPISNNPPAKTNSNSSGEKNLLQKINPFYTGTALAVGTALTTKSVGWTIFSFALGTISHHAYRVNRESN